MKGWVIVVILAGIGMSADAVVINVPGDLPTIQEAIDAAMDFDEIRVAPGAYAERIDFLGKAIIVRATGGAGVTLIDGMNEGTVVTCATSEGPMSVLEGFTISGGFDELGGGMRINASHPTVRDCIFLGNTGGLGGGIYCAEGGAPEVTGCMFVQNAAGFGGGVYSLDSMPIIVGCDFALNVAGFGGGIANEGSHGIIRECTFAENAADVGGAIANILQSSPEITLCTMAANTAVDGGAVYNSGMSSPCIVNCTMMGNTADSEGGGVANVTGSSPIIAGGRITDNAACFGGAVSNNVSSSPTIANCTMSGNTADFGGGMYTIESSVPRVTNCIVWANSPDQFLQPFGPIFAISFSDVQDGWPGPNNIAVDPGFVDADGPDNDPATFADNDYRLAAGSPCIDAGLTNAVPADEADIDDDGDVTERLPIDLDGNPRFADDLATADTGCGVPAIVDMGAYEFPGVSFSPVIPGDIDGDGIVGFGDLVAVLAGFGPCRTDCCTADVNGDGTVNFADLVLILANFNM